ncbi:multidrug efflux SMR transporter [Bacillus sp. FSL W8-0445]|uniref:Multidrug efflux SMR transporter n=1 Tax=Bacillus licheniformis TaxID=1402 RepID=A0AB37GZT9_BACLI|nr:MULTISPECIES: multidrug efflux SMR transporter [Bacillus]APJ27031.1 QacE family quaternary ammonium compound efflux SMR transporter [Bacillus sp. H15-1]ASV15418.1 QacE family quaternary ammonium compound efflux SMR transporter [Bacillus sp. 1s-1]MBC9086333.1 multidrug efflux SMR transporter [Bacillus sp. Y1]MBJ7887454.1 multidrug efflux SMR transporter [Bacillaceae bacterium HSR45]MBY8346590.1 multidrug efflux SMR transporter [Bacillus sp. PCH94]NBB42494.1 EamA family transporter [Bacillus
MDRGGFRMIAGYIFLLIAILSEAAAAAMLKISDGFARWQPSVLVVIGYGLAFYMMSLTLQVIPLSLSYATWSGAGTVLTAIIGVLWFQEKLNRRNIAGIICLVSGVVLINLS